MRKFSGDGGFDLDTAMRAAEDGPVPLTWTDRPSLVLPSAGLYDDLVSARDARAVAGADAAMREVVPEDCDPGTGAILRDLR